MKKTLALVALVLAVAPAAASARPAAAKISPAEFRTQMRQLWVDHVVWTRMVIVAFAAGSPDLKAAETRLLRNQVDIGNAIKPYYGAAAGSKLTALLRQHILEAVPVLSAAKAGDTVKLAAARKAWYANANVIAHFLSSANPKSWPFAATGMMMKMHLDLTTAEAVARLKGQWAADVRAYDKVQAEIMQMADALASGIVAQFPSRFAG
ncbi:MAG: glycosyltransferase [Gaiellaceae bacterium]